MTTPDPAPIALRRLDTPIGRIEVVGNGSSIVSLAIERAGALPHDDLDERPDAVTDRALAQLVEYFAGARHDFDVPVSLAGTAFQLSVWEQLVSLEWGEVISYGELGHATGRESAGRAVGGAVGANPIPIIVPCHRVLGSNGRITGYSGGEGVPTKAWLLAHEGITHRLPATPTADISLTLDLPDDGESRRRVTTSDLRVGDDGLARCGWVGDDAEYRRYHDEEWGVALHGDRPLFEKLSLEGFQAGLSWITILRRRPTFRAAFRDFDVDAVAAFDDADIERLMDDPGIIRNRAKVLATISNAQVTRELTAHDPGALDRLVWSFRPDPSGRPRPRSLSEVPAVTPEATALSKALKKQGYRFVGPTTMYALMQSAGLVDDHLVGCWRTVDR